MPDNLPPPPPKARIQKGSLVRLNVNNQEVRAVVCHHIYDAGSHNITHRLLAVDCEDMEGLLPPDAPLLTEQNGERAYYIISLKRKHFAEAALASAERYGELAEAVCEHFGDTLSDEGHFPTITPEDLSLLDDEYEGENDESGEEEEEEEGEQQQGDNANPLNNNNKEGEQEKLAREKAEREQSQRAQEELKKKKNGTKKKQSRLDRIEEMMMQLIANKDPNSSSIPAGDNNNNSSGSGGSNGVETRSDNQTNKPTTLTPLGEPPENHYQGWRREVELWLQVNKGHKDATLASSLLNALRGTTKAAVLSVVPDIANPQSIMDALETRLSGTRTEAFFRTLTDFFSYRYQEHQAAETKKGGSKGIQGHLDRVLHIRQMISGTGPGRDSITPLTLPSNFWGWYTIYTSGLGSDTASLHKLVRHLSGDFSLENVTRAMQQQLGTFEVTPQQSVAVNNTTAANNSAPSSAATSKQDLNQMVQKLFAAQLRGHNTAQPPRKGGPKGGDKKGGDKKGSEKGNENNNNNKNKGNRQWFPPCPNPKPAECADPACWSTHHHPGQRHQPR